MKTDPVLLGLYSCPTCGRAMGDMSSLWGFLDKYVYLLLTIKRQTIQNFSEMQSVNYLLSCCNIPIKLSK